MNAIVYTSNTGFTAQYAKLLGEKLCLPVYPLNTAEEELAAGTEILYLGWLMAGKVKGYKQAAKRYRIAVVCGVGMHTATIDLSLATRFLYKNNSSVGGTDWRPDLYRKWFDEILNDENYGK